MAIFIVWMLAALFVASFFGSDRRIGFWVLFFLFTTTIFSSLAQTCAVGKLSDDGSIFVGADSRTTRLFDILNKFPVKIFPEIYSTNR